MYQRISPSLLSATSTNPLSDVALLYATVVQSVARSALNMSHIQHICSAGLLTLLVYRPTVIAHPTTTSYDRYAILGCILC